MEAETRVGGLGRGARVVRWGRLGYGKARLDI